MSDFEEMFAEVREHINRVRAVFGGENRAAVPLFENFPCYPMDKLVVLGKLAVEIEALETEEEIRAKLPEFRKLRLQIESLRHESSRRKICLWEGKRIPCNTVYTDNSSFRFNHDPDFVPYLYEMLLPEDVTPKGAVIMCAGGDHGFTVLAEGYQTALDFNQMGYQCFVLLNRTNLNPWSGQEAGADAARAIRIVRAGAEKYRIPRNRIAFAGYSNGGLTGEACIQYYSGTQKMKDVFPDYEDDELDRVSADMDAFLCIYGPRFAHQTFDYTNVVYPKTFHALGLLDFNMPNICKLYPELIERGITVELHTFAGVPHGKAGSRLVDGFVQYPGFETWESLADAFLMNAFG